MLESIEIAQVATFGVVPEILADLRQFNYIFGPNGTGKTTISRIIGDVAFGPACKRCWHNAKPLEALVLNRDFVERNFGQLRGVFTLGEKQKEAMEKIEGAKKELDKENQSLATLKKTLEGDDGTGGKKGEFADIEQEFQDRCWQQKQKHDPKLQGAFTGCRSSGLKFKERVLQEAASNKAEFKDLATLEKRAATIFAEAPVKQAGIPLFDSAALLDHESNPILRKRVVGKDHVNIAALITKLGNSDWVRQGRRYYNENDKLCPFCQQKTAGALADSLKEYFDETFEKESGEISKIVSRYPLDAASLQSTIGGIINAPGQFLDIEKMKAQKALLDQRIRTNEQKLEQKKKEPSQGIELEPLQDVLTSIKNQIDIANGEIAKHNEMIDNLSTEKATLTSEVWRFVLNELDGDLKKYHDKKSAVQKAVEGINQKILSSNERAGAKEKEIRNLEKQTTSIQPTINAINDILVRFGFESFKLAMAQDAKHYKLVRQNGEDARQTLSEGEKTFVVFLYFYHLLKGSIAESGMTTDRVVVFDDPVSSLDSDVLFIVSSLIREVCDNARNGSASLKQVFVLTHNVYFFKEITFNIKRPQDGILSEESFWIVRKAGQSSRVERHNCNPVKTSYEMLWMEIRKAANGNVRIENTLRRILEHYFTILGSINRDEICGKFAGQDKLICKALFSWVNAGSHSALDDAHITPSDAMTQHYLRVFKEVFDRTGHIAHYKMMMHDAVVEGPDLGPVAKANKAASDAAVASPGQLWG